MNFTEKMPQNEENKELLKRAEKIEEMGREDLLNFVVEMQQELGEVKNSTEEEKLRLIYNSACSKLEEMDNDKK
jgi:hypothetical protein